VVGPEALLNFFPRNHFTRIFEQNRQNLKRLILNFEFDAVLPQLS
jgi:hypothetical protein